MPLASDPLAADFSAMAPNGGADGPLYLTHVVHEAFVQIDELGTEAAAATAVVGDQFLSSPPPPPEHEERRSGDELAGLRRKLRRLTERVDALEGREQSIVND